MAYGAVTGAGAGGRGLPRQWQGRACEIMGCAEHGMCGAWGVRSMGCVVHENIVFAGFVGL